MDDVAATTNGAGVEQQAWAGGSAPGETTKRIVTFGEALLRLSPPDHLPLVDTGALTVAVGGAEANVAVGVRQLGMPARWVSCLPRNLLGQRVERFLASHGVDTADVAWTDEGRLGVYFVEHGAPPRPSRVVYDRAGSSFARVDAPQYDWPRLLADAAVFHTSGVTPALGDQAAKAVQEAVGRAGELGLTVSYDLNYRAHLWSHDEADRFCAGIIEGVDVLFCSRAELARLLGHEGDLPQLAADAHRRWGVREIVATQRVHGGVGYAAVAEGDHAESPTYEPATVDRIGAGDAAAAAYLTERLRGGDLPAALALAAAAAAWQQTIPGDAPRFSLAELRAVADDRPTDVRR